MAVFETLIGLLLVAALLLQLSRRIRAPYPTMLALAGACVAAFSLAPQMSLDPHLALVLFVSPALFNAAYDTSPHELRRDWFPLTALALFAVVLTTAAVAWAGWAYAGLPLAAAIALGAIVAPPDAAAASAVLTNLGLPRRTMTVLQGESLLNDAIALLLFGVAVAVSERGPVDLPTLVPQLLLAAPGGILLGLAAGYVFVRLWPIWSGTMSSTILEFAATFAVWLIAERLAVSPVLAIVAYAILIAQKGPDRQTARDRVHSYSVWAATIFILNVLAFLLMGMQAREILQSLERRELLDALAFAGIVFVIVVAVRLVWVMTYRELLGPLFTAMALPAADGGNRRLRLLVSWCGMRGILTLATAFSLPTEFPGRNVIVLSAFMVVLGTLIVQGATIAFVIRLLGIPPDSSLDTELRAGRAKLAKAAIAALSGRTEPDAAPLRAKLEATLAQTRRKTAGEDDEAEDLRMVVVAAERQTLNEMHRTGAIAEDAFQVLQEELDWFELNAAPRTDREIAET
ncbi:MAG: Na+/H+ antiporter [Rubritepida sp.]|nr:Na+/H+ antiporter [Rubritepida sp.]